MSEGYALLVFECAWCGRMDTAEPELVTSVDSRRDREGHAINTPGERNPLCEVCARWLVDYYRGRGWPITPQQQQQGYFERAYP